MGRGFLLFEPFAGLFLWRGMRRHSRVRQHSLVIELIIANLATDAKEMDGDVFEVGDPNVTIETVGSNAAEIEAEEAYEAACRAREQAEDDWVDSVVEESDRIAKAKKQQKEQQQKEQQQKEKKKEAAEEPCFAPAFARLGLRCVAAASKDRRTVANRSFRAGEVVLRSPAAGCVLSPSCATTRCHHCLCESAQLKRCSACGYARYCCAAHQRDAWPAHKAECQALRMTKPRVPGPTVLLLLRLLTALEQPRKKKDEAAATGGGPPLADAVDALQVHFETLSDERRAELVHQAQMTVSLLRASATATKNKDNEDNDDDSSARAGAMATRLLALLATNAHTICDEELQPIGLGLYPLASLTNHSCEPSAAQTFDASGQLVLRALRPLEVGEEVTIGYIELGQSAAARRAELKSSYLFDCACARCERESAPAAEAALADAANRLSASRTRTIAAIDAQRWGEALEAARECCKQCDVVLPRVLPSAGIERLRLAKLLSHQGDLINAVAAWRHAHAILAVTHGDDSPLVRRLCADLNAAAAEIDVAALKIG